MNLPKPKKRSGFTLVELLVVIGIITVLIGILLPSLSKARANANSTACQSNLRQIAMAMLMYANDNKGHLPNYGYLTSSGAAVNYDPIGTDIYNPSAGLWTEAIHPYLSTAPRVASAGAAHNWNLSNNFLRCPAASEQAVTPSTTLFYWTYGVNYGFASGSTQQPGIFSYYQLTGNSNFYTGSRLLTKIQPSEFLVCDISRQLTAVPPAAFNNKYNSLDTDTDGDGVLDSASSLLNNVADHPDGQYNFVSFRHPPGVNYATADGSVHSALVRAWFTNTGNIWSAPIP
jgi:prepilin-type N-terminal cleavage/methylation domain-containing protein/prepilin-type processing-associated H-X9-DG protein